MEYALEGHGYCWSRVLRGRPSYRDQSPQARIALDADIDQLALMRDATGVSPGRVEAPPELLASLHVRAPSGPRAALAFEVAAAVNSIFDGVARANPLRITHCTAEDGAGEGASLVLGAMFPGISADVATGDTVTAGLVIALRGDPGPGGGGAYVDILSRLFRKVCENGAIVHELDEPAVQIDLRQVGAGANAIREAIARRVTAALDPVLFKRCIEAFQTSTADALDHRGGALGALLRHALPYDTWKAVLGRFAAEPWTRWGLANAVTAEARWAPTFAEAARLERIGGFLARTPGRAYTELPPGLLDPAGSAAPIEAPPAEKIPAS